MKNIIKITILGVALSLLSGCVGWTKLDNYVLEGPSGDFSIRVPDGWRQFRGGPYNGMIMVSANGPLLSKMLALHSNHDDDYFDKIKKTTSAKTLPAELAELYIALLKTNSDLHDIQVLDNQPGKLGNKSAFRLHLQYKTVKGLRIDRVVYGFSDKKGIYLVLFEAPKLHYFSKFIGRFEDSVKTFKRS